MKFFRPVVCTAISLMFAAGAWAQDPVDHKAHHPESASATATSTSAVAKPVAATESIKKMDEQMKMMRDMHKKMMSAKTPEERSALMVDHMEAMQGGMAMMGKMNNMGAGTKSKMKADMSPEMDMHQMMEKRMEMMEGMMQMMMDRMPSPAPTK